MVFADSLLGEVMREELGASHDEPVCAFDEALSFNAHAVAAIDIIISIQNF